ncbi:Lipoprotein-releasing system ATP-binding protein LolD [bacterium HR36]|nr:Lipoprotein-releasing system ATP-binding protein LolD [bacterium HR36]
MLIRKQGKEGELLLEAREVHKAYRKGKHEIQVLRGVNLQVAFGEFVAIVGASGSGKSTLLHVLGTLDVPDSGEVWLAGRRVDRLAAWEKDRLRNREMGFVFQFYHLLPELTLLENVLMPAMIRTSALGWLWQCWRARKQAWQWLQRLHLTARARSLPKELSGGEMQRAAIARALINGPRLLLADEPTGNLDPEAAREIAELLHDLNRRDGLTIIMVTHNWELAQQAERVLRLAEGKLTNAASQDNTPLVLMSGENRK